MKVSHLISASLVAATAWADDEETYAFFAKVDGKFKALIAEKTNTDYVSMLWDDSFVDATEFIYEDGYALLSTAPDDVGIFLSFEEGIQLNYNDKGPRARLELESGTKRLLNSFYYSCKRENDNIILAEKESENDGCFLVDIYFTEYNSETKRPAREIVSIDNIRTPHVFYVSGEDYWEPLYSDTLELDDSSHLVSLYHGKSNGIPVEFYTQNSYAITVQHSINSGYVMFEGNGFGFRSILNLDSKREVGDTDLVFTEDGQVLARRFFSCKDDESEDRKILLDPSGYSDWKEVDIYLVDNNNKNEKPKDKSIRPQKGADLNPYGFFVRQNGMWIPLVFKKIPHSVYPRAFVPSPSERKDAPTQFSLKNDIAYTLNQPSLGFAGINGEHLVFGSGIEQTPFVLTEEYLIEDYLFYMREDRSIYTTTTYDPNGLVDVYLMPLDGIDEKVSDRGDIPVDDDRGMGMPTSSLSTLTMAASSESSVTSMSDIQETSFSTVSETSVRSMSETSVRSMSDIPESSIPSDSEIPKSSTISMSRTSETSISSMSKVPESSIPSMSEISESSVRSMSDIPETSVSTMIRSSHSSFSTMAESSQPSISNMAKSSESYVSTMADTSSSSGISHTPRPSTSMSAVTEETSIDESSKGKPTTLTRKTTTTATICTECQAASTVTEWNTHTNFVTYCPERTTVTFSTCNKGCYLTTTTVTSATTVTCPGVCIIPTTIIVNGPAETANVGHYGPKDTVKSPSNLNNPAEIVKAGEGSQNGGANIIGAGGSAQKGGEDIKVAGGSTPESPVGSPSSANSPNRIGKVEDSQKQGDSNNQGNSNKEGNSNKPGNGSTSPKPKSGNSDTTTTQTLTGTVTAPNVSSFNGASKNAIGACVLGFAALLL